jgi:hypothetical protein
MRKLKGKNKIRTVLLITYTDDVALGGLVVACLPLDPRFAGSNPVEGDKSP